MDTGNMVIAGGAIVVVGLIGYAVVSSVNRQSMIASQNPGGVYGVQGPQGPALDGDSAGGVLFGLFSGLGPLVSGIGSAVAANRRNDAKTPSTGGAAYGPGGQVLFNGAPIGPGNSPARIGI